MNESPRADRVAWLVVGFGLIATWWLPILSQPILTFYKEWLFVLALGIGGLALDPMDSGRKFLRRHPLVLAAAASVVVLSVQSLIMDGVWRRATLLTGGAGTRSVLSLYQGLDRTTYEIKRLDARQSFT